MFDLACVPDHVREGFSKRTVQVDAKHAELIRRWSDEHDGRTPDAKMIGKLERRAAKASRPDKTHGRDAETLHAEWTREAQGMGFDPAGLVPDRLVDERRTGWTIPDDDLIDEALLHASDEASAWLRADLARHLATILDTRTFGSGAGAGRGDRPARRAWPKHVASRSGPHPTARSSSGGTGGRSPST